MIVSMVVVNRMVVVFSCLFSSGMVNSMDRKGCSICIWLMCSVLLRVRLWY